MGFQCYVYICIDDTDFYSINLGAHSRIHSFTKDIYSIAAYIILSTSSYILYFNNMFKNWYDSFPGLKIQKIKLLHLSLDNDDMLQLIFMIIFRVYAQNLVPYVENHTFETNLDLFYVNSTILKSNVPHDVFIRQGFKAN